MTTPNTITRGEYVARRLLTNSATGSISHLTALAKGYPYHCSDLRPFEAVIPFLQGSPPSLPTLSSVSDATIRTLACLEIIDRVGLSLKPNHTCYATFSVRLREEWPSIVAWLTFSVEDSVNFAPHQRLTVSPISTVARFLSRYFTRPPFASTGMGARDASVDLAFRIWGGEFHETVPLNEVTQAVMEFLSNCLDVEGEAKTTVLDHFAEPNTAQSFFKSYTTQLTTRAEDLSPEGMIYTFQLHGFYMYLIGHLSKSPSWRAIWRCTVKKGTFRAYAVSTFILLSGPVYVERWMLADLGALIQAAEEDPKGILAKVTQICREDLVPLLYECVHTGAPDVGDPVHSQSLVVKRLRHLESYLPYPNVSRVVTESLRCHFANRPQYPSHIMAKEWKLFHSALRFSTLSHSKQDEYYAFACDSLKHLARQIRGNNTSGGQGRDTSSRRECRKCGTVFYCSTECQRDDWKSLHRYECASATAMRHARRQSQQWFPWGSKGNLGGLLVHFFNILSAKGMDMGPMGSVTTLDWTLGVPSSVESCSPEDYIASSAGRSPPYAHDRLKAMLSSSSETGIRLVDGTYRHGKERIHVLAALQEGQSPNEYTFLHGVGMIRLAANFTTSLLKPDEGFLFQYDFYSFPDLLRCILLALFKRDYANGFKMQLDVLQVG
ncbi:hypothetical protein DFP72DRAFT_847327 [Ephemerocybe angulata]|uniref:MYND-type domain-containing protein n=1 Tax=Ephemerocybe angulata TaxID=980116 RepID=A0A8H6M5K7_9AGAR|nr:hypothetical protein DFP72DRAFT_847327 [Tulosesus angulatus]